MFHHLIPSLRRQKNSICHNIQPAPNYQPTYPPSFRHTYTYTYNISKTDISLGSTLFLEWKKQIRKVKPFLCSGVSVDTKRNQSAYGFSKRKTRLYFILAARCKSKVVYIDVRLQFITSVLTIFRQMGINSHYICVGLLHACNVTPHRTFSISQI